jgi:hypothetical protein
MKCWLVCQHCGTKELLTKLTKFDGGCLHCGGGPRVARNDNDQPILLWSEPNDITSWDVPSESGSIDYGHKR